MSAESRNPYLRANSLSELLSWQDQDFVRCAYVTILGRQPDPEGEYQYVERVREGESRLKILWELRQSPEARKHDPGIRGLDRKLRRARWQRQPLIGWPLRLLSSNADRNGVADRRHRARLNAAALERYALHNVYLKLSGIEWLVDKRLGVGQEPDRDSDKGRSEVSGPAGSLRRPKALLPVLKHLAPKSPLVRYFVSELN